MPPSVNPQPHRGLRIAILETQIAILKMQTAIAAPHLISSSVWVDISEAEVTVAAAVTAAAAAGLLWGTAANTQR